MSLNADQTLQFEAEGYLVVEGALSVERLEQIRSEYSRLMDRLYAGWEAEGRVSPGATLDFWGKLSAAYAAGCDWFQPMDISLPGGAIEMNTPMHFGEAAFEMITDSHLLDIVERLLGPEITSNPIQHIRIKPPSRDVHAQETRAHVGLTHWHQDQGVTLPEADGARMVTVWLAITDVTEQSAPLQVIPRMHRAGLIEHCGKAQTSIPKALLDPAQAVTLPCPAGSAVLLHPLTPHASLPNRSDRFRWSFDIRYTRTGEPTGRSHFPSFIARSRARPEAAMACADDWREMWIEARGRLAGQAPVPIHRWQATSPVCA